MGFQFIIDKATGGNNTKILWNPLTWMIGQNLVPDELYEFF